MYFTTDLQDKLEKAQNELRRAQAELRLNQSDYERSQVEMEQMQEKVCIFFILLFCIWWELPAEISWPASNKGKVLSHCAPLVAHKARSSCANLRPGVPSRTFDHSYAVRAPDFCLFPPIWSLWTAKFYSSAPSSFRIHGAPEEMSPAARLRDISISFLAPGMDSGHLRQFRSSTTSMAHYLSDQIDKYCIFSFL